MVTTNKINVLILKESELWDVPHANIKHALLGSVVCYAYEWGSIGIKAL